MRGMFSLINKAPSPQDAMQWSPSESVGCDRGLGDSPSASPSPITQLLQFGFSPQFRFQAAPSDASPVSYAGSPRNRQAILRIAGAAASCCCCLQWPCRTEAGARASPHSPRKQRSLDPERDDVRWWRVHQVDDINFYVRRDLGPTALRPVASTQAVRGIFRGMRPLAEVPKRPSLPSALERTMGIDIVGFDRDAFSNVCRVCYERQAEVVTLPCRHCGLCKDCYRNALFSRPAHRGGRSCPFCRGTIREALQLLIPKNGAAVQYGYSVDVY
mmetsp:Transcript_52227/g.152064  ORF Transcript_52227/g.152064 Transcript_52227/m.152064 type:complete len:272 (+) Transcript_52227:127-942(+)